MPKIAHAQEQEIRRAIRDAYALDPIMTMKKLLEFLEKRFGKPFDWEYINRLKKKVDGEATPRLDQQKIEERLRDLRETFRLGRENLLQIAYGNIDPRPTPGERNSAWRTITMMQKMLLDAEIALGIYNKQLPEDAESFRWRPVPPEIMENIIRTFTMWKLPADLTRKLEAPPSIVIDAKPVQFTEKNNNASTATKPKPAQPVRIGPAPDPEFLGV